MRFGSPHRAFLIVVGVLLACANGNGAPAFSTDAVPPLALPSVRIAEIHYDNTGTDTGEAIEISGPAGTSLTGWQIVLLTGPRLHALRTTRNCSAAQFPPLAERAAWSCRRIR